MSGHDEEELTRRASAGDEEAFTILYRRHHRAVYRFALLMSGSEATAQDVTQEVFLVLIQQGDRFDASRAALSTYLCAIARNFVLRRFRSERFVDSLPEDGEATEGNVWLSSAIDPFAECERRQRVEMLREAVLALPIVYREVVVLCDLEEMKYADAAAIVGCRPGTIASRLHRGHALLWEKLRSMQIQGQGDTQ